MLRCARVCRSQGAGGEERFHAPAWPPVLLLVAVLAATSYSPAQQSPPPAPVPSESKKEAYKYLADIVGQGCRIHRSEHFVLASRSPVTRCSAYLREWEIVYERGRRFCRLVSIPVKAEHPPLEVIQFDTQQRFASAIVDFPIARRDLAKGVFHQFHNRFYSFDPAMDTTYLDCRIDEDPRIIGLRSQIEELRKALRQPAFLTGRIKLTLRRPSGKEEMLDAEGATGYLRTVESLLEATKEDIREEICTAAAATWRHECAHQVLYNLGAHARNQRNPMWLVEGVATLLEYPVEEPAAIGYPLDPRSYRFLMQALGLRSGDPGPWSPAFARAVAEGKLIGLPAMLSDRAWWQIQKTHSDALYAQAWSLVYYLVTTQPARLGAYMRHFIARGPNEDAPEQVDLLVFSAAFGRPDESFVNRWIGDLVRLPDPRGTKDHPRTHESDADDDTRESSTLRNHP